MRKAYRGAWPRSQIIPVYQREGVVGVVVLKLAEGALGEEKLAGTRVKAGSVAVR